MVSCMAHFWGGVFQVAFLLFQKSLDGSGAVQRGFAQGGSGVWSRASEDIVGTERVN